MFRPATTQCVADKLAKSESNGYDDDDGRDDHHWGASDAGCGGGGGGGGGGGAGGGKQMCLRLPELIDTLAKEGQVLRWDEGQRIYEVRIARRASCRRMLAILCSKAMYKYRPPPPQPSPTDSRSIIVHYELA